MNEGVSVRGAAHEEFVCEVVDELTTLNRKAWNGLAEKGKTHKVL